MTAWEFALLMGGVAVVVQLALFFGAEYALKHWVKIGQGCGVCRHDWKGLIHKETDRYARHCERCDMLELGTPVWMTMEGY